MRPCMRRLLRAFDMRGQVEEARNAAAALPTPGQKQGVDLCRPAHLDGHVARVGRSETHVISIMSPHDGWRHPPGRGVTEQQPRSTGWLTTTGGMHALNSSRSEQIFSGPVPAKARSASDTRLEQGSCPSHLGIFEDLKCKSHPTKLRTLLYLDSGGRDLVHKQKKILKV